MRRTTALILSGAATAAVILGAPSVQAQTYALPENPAEPVITLDYQGGRLKRIDDAPVLSILADGRVVMPQLFAHTQAYESRISSTELQDLLGFIIEQNRFFEPEPDAVQTGMRRLRPQPFPLHLATTVLRVEADHSSNEVRYVTDLSAAKALALGDTLAVEDGVEAVARLLAIEHRLEQLMATVKLGGRGEVAQWLASANQELAAEYPQAEGLSIDDLEAGTRRADGSVYVRFVRRDAAAVTSVTIDLTADGERYVTVALEGQ